MSKTNEAVDVDRLAETMRTCFASLRELPPGEREVVLRRARLAAEPAKAVALVTRPRQIRRALRALGNLCDLADEHGLQQAHVARWLRVHPSELSRLKRVARTKAWPARLNARLIERLSVVTGERELAPWAGTMGDL